MGSWIESGQPQRISAEESANCTSNPTSKSEIVKVLKAADSAICAIQDRVATLLELKRSLLQNLLTGKIQNSRGFACTMPEAMETGPIRFCLLFNRETTVEREIIEHPEGGQAGLDLALA